jgi:hypothetical protein
MQNETGTNNKPKESVNGWNELANSESASIISK